MSKITTLILGIMFLLNMPVFAKESTIPEPLAQLSPGDMCAHYGNSSVWNIKAQLAEYEGQPWLVVYFNPTYTVVNEPQVTLKATLVVYEGKINNNYYYRIEKLSKLKDIGTVTFETDTRNIVQHRHSPNKLPKVVDRYITMRMRTVDNSKCLELTPY